MAMLRISDVLQAMLRRCGGRMTRRPVAVIAVLLLATGLGHATRLPDAEEAGRPAVILRVADALGLATADNVVRGLAVGADRNARLVVLRPAQPGGPGGPMRAGSTAAPPSPVRGVP